LPNTSESIALTCSNFSSDLSIQNSNPVSVAAINGIALWDEALSVISIIEGSLESALV